MSLNQIILSAMQRLIMLYNVVMPWPGILTGVVGLIAAQAVFAQRWVLAKWALFVAVLGVVVVSLPMMANVLLAWFQLPERWIADPMLEYLWVVAVVMGVVATLAWYRWIWPSIADWSMSWLIRPSRQERSKRTDARTVAKSLPAEIREYDPRRYFNLRRGVFVGLNEHRKPIYIPNEIFSESHISLCGRTRSGKGVAAQSLLVQALMRDEFVLILDPKGDEWLPSVLRQASLELGKPYHFINLQPSSPPQINPICDMNHEDAENVLIAALSLSDRGDMADFHRVNDRRAALDCARAIGNGSSQTLRNVFEAEASRWEKASPGFHEALWELAELHAINKSGGKGLVELAARGGVVYVVGDMNNSRIVRAQRLLLVRLLQIARRRKELGIQRQFLVMADEFVVHISRVFMTTLGASAGWGLRAILAFQSLQDLSQAPADLSVDAVRGSIAENCAISLTYKLKDPDTAEWVAKSTGKILVDDEIKTVKANWALAETVSPERTISIGERYQIDINELLMLPKRCGVLIGASDKPQFCFTSAIKVVHDSEAHCPTLADPAASCNDYSLSSVGSLAQSAIDLP